MCGIAGICSELPLGRDELQRALATMNARLVHRGPDEEGRFVGPRVALGSRRLKVIDLSTGTMPIANESEDVWVVYNGEIYNHTALRHELEGRGHVFRTRTDTEVLVHLYEDDGIDFVNRLIGMFAFALWDGREEVLYLVRDRLGIKPLHYRVDGTTLTFASELKGLLSTANAEPQIDVDALAEYLALGYIRAPRTIYQGYRKLTPGTVLEFRRGQVRTFAYWEFPADAQSFEGKVDDAVDALEESLSRAVEDRLIADVPLGFFLSGGIDSSLVVALAAQRAPGRLKTFSVGFPGNHELGYARTVARRFDTDHHELVLEADACRIIDRLLGFFDEPFGDSSCIPTYFVSELARRHVTVALSGDGGDELFAGYHQYTHDGQLARFDLLPQPIRRLIFGGAARVLSPGAFGHRRLRALAATREERFAQFSSYDLDPRSGGLLRPGLLSRVPSPVDLFAESFRRAAGLPFPARLLHVDATNYLPDDILTKVDRMSMAHSLEARVPLLDHRFVELATRMPGDWKLRDGGTKWILKRLAARYLPPEILQRPKQGFAIPVAHWLRNELSPLVALLLEPDAPSREYLYSPTVERLVGEHQRGRRDHSYVLWRLIMLELWLRRSGTSANRPLRPDLVAAMNE